MVKASAFVPHVHSNAFPVKGCFSPNIWISRTRISRTSIAIALIHSKDPFVS